MDGFNHVGMLIGSQYTFDRSAIPTTAGLYVFQFENGCVWNIGEGGATGRGLRTLLRYGPWLPRQYPDGSTPRLRKKYDAERRRQREWKRLVKALPLHVWIKDGDKDTAARRAEELRLTNQHQPIWNIYRKTFGRTDPASDEAERALAECERLIRLGINQDVRAGL